MFKEFFEKVKEVGKKVINKIVEVVKKIAGLVKDNAEEIATSLGDIGLCVIIFGTTEVVIKNKALEAALGFNLGLIGALTAWIGAFALSIIASHMLAKYIHEDFVDISESIEQVKSAINAATEGVTIDG